MSMTKLNNKISVRKFDIRKFICFLKKTINLSVIQ